ncbi:MAG: hypothetical protein ACRDBG_14505, partial [Waterburya sp.]
LKAQIEDNKIKFDIDIEPLKRKIEDVKDSFQGASGGGTTKVLNQEVADQINKASLTPVVQIDPKKIDEVTNNLLGKFGKTIAKGDLTSAIGDLIQGGITEVSQIDTLLTRFVETGSKSRAGSQNLGQAINNLSQDFKNQNSALSQNSGLAENYSDIVKIGTGVLREQALAVGDKTKADRLATGQLTEAETRQAQFQGTLYFTNDTLGSYENALKSGLLVQSEFNQTIQKTSEGFGKELTPAFGFVIGGANDLLKSFNSLLQTTPSLGVALTGFTGITLMLGTGFGLLAIAGVAITGTMLGIGATVVGIGLLVAGLYVAWNNNFLGIQDIVRNTFNAIGGFYNTSLKPTIDSIVKLFLDTVNSITGFFTNGSITWQEKLGALLGFFVTLPFKVAGLIPLTIKTIFEALSKVDWGGVWNGLLDGLKNTWKGIESFFKSIDVGQLFKGIGNGLIDLMIGIIKGLGAGIPGA